MIFLCFNSIFLEILATSVTHNVFFWGGGNFLNLIIFLYFNSIFLEILATSVKNTMFFLENFSQPNNIFMLCFFLEILPTSVNDNVFGKKFLNLKHFFMFS